MKLQENDIAFAVNDLVESIPDEAFENFLRKTGRPAYPRLGTMGMISIRNKYG